MNREGNKLLVRNLAQWVLEVEIVYRRKIREFRPKPPTQLGKRSGDHPHLLGAIKALDLGRG